MALYGEARDISFFRNINRELISNIISEECVYYKYMIKETKVNMYGEAAEGRYFADPVILSCLIERSDQEFPESDMGVDFSWAITFKFLIDDLLNKMDYDFNYDFEFSNVYGANLVPEVGDVIMYQNGYWEVDSTNSNQFFRGLDPNYPNNDDNGNNPLSSPGPFNLKNYGWNTSVICQAHYVPADRINIKLARL
jgi:hypothetical protein